MVREDLYRGVLDVWKALSGYIIICLALLLGVMWLESEIGVLGGLIALGMGIIGFALFSRGWVRRDDPKRP